MKDKKQQIMILKANLGKGKNSDRWIRSALKVLESNDFGNYKRDIAITKRDISRIKETNYLKIIELEIDYRAKLWSYDYLTF